MSKKLKKKKIEQKQGWEQITKGVFGARIKEEAAESQDQSSGTNRSTIGNTTISTEKASIIKKEVRCAIQQAFPGIHFSTGQPQAEVIDLTGSTAHSEPLAIAG